MGHKPSRLVRHPQHAVKLMGANPLLGRTEKMNSQQPFVQGDVAILENRVHRDCELPLAGLALPRASANVLVLLARLRSEFVCLSAIAMRAHRTVRPTLFF